MRDGSSRRPPGVNDGRRERRDGIVIETISGSGADGPQHGAVAFMVVSWTRALEGSPVEFLRASPRPPVHRDASSMKRSLHQHDGGFRSMSEGLEVWTRKE